MPEWRVEVRRRLRLEGLDPRRAETLVDEIACQLEEVYTEARAAGLSEEEARARVEAEVPDWQGLARELGGRPQARPTSGRHLPRPRRWLSDVVRDLAYGLRQMRREPVFSALAVLTLGLAIGLNTAIFSVVNVLLFRELPADAPHELASVWNVGNGSLVTHEPLAYPDYADLRDQTNSFEALAAYALRPLALESDAGSEMVMGELVTENYFEMLGTRPALGRLFQSQDGRERGGDPFVVLNHRAWLRRFGGDPSVIGRQLRLNGNVLTVIGVAPPGFNGLLLGMSPELWVPMMMEPPLRGASLVNSSDGESVGSSLIDRRSARWLWVLGRLAPGRAAADADAELHAVGERLRQDFPDTNRERVVAVLPASDVKLIPGVDGVLYATSGVLLGVVALVLLIASANVANMLLARSAGRRREFAVRLALGCGRGRLVRQLLAESLLLAGSGGALGLALAAASNAALNSLALPLPVQLAFGLALDAKVLAFTLAVTGATAMAFGLWPALSAARQDPAPALKDGPAMVSQRAGQRLSGSLVVVQVSLSLVLLIGAGLSIRSLSRAHDVDPGFRPRGLVTASLSPSLQSWTQQRAEPVYAELQDRLRALPGVVSVGTASHLPLTFEINIEDAAPEGAVPSEGQDWPEVDAGGAGPGYFETLEIPILRGRAFEPTDAQGAPQVAIVNETLAARLWPGQDPLGRRLAVAKRDDFWTVVGVARDGKYRTLGEGPRGYFYRPLAQTGHVDRVVVIRHTGPAPLVLAALRDTARQLADRVPIVGLQTVDEALAGTLLLPRSGATLFGLLGALGLVLAGAGLYGVLAYSISRRTREIGLRMALGASRAQVLRLVLGGGLKLVTIGLAIGLPLAVGLSHAIEAVLYGISPTDALTFAGVSLLMLLTAASACLVPARRAVRVDPMTALRHE